MRKSLTFKDVLARKADLVGGMVCNGNTPMARIKSMQGLFGKGVLIHLESDGRGKGAKLMLTDKDFRVTMMRAGRIRIDLLGSGQDYVALLPKTHPRVQAAA